MLELYRELGLGFWNLKVFFLFQNIMKDKWMNMGYEEEELKPYVEPEPDYKDQKRIGMLLSFFWQQMLHKMLT